MSARLLTHHSTFFVESRWYNGDYENANEDPEIWGTRDQLERHRFDSSIVFIDPYAKLIEGCRYFGDAKYKLTKFLGTYDFDSLPFDWGSNYNLPNIPEKDLVVYEMNVRAFTIDQSSGSDPDIRGSYLGVIKKGNASLLQTEPVSDRWHLNPINLKTQEC
ncbi:hypothetical protein Dsin_007134 [Dipteronia sinensis]|uniref:Uncharacterized protein n=1 Tax=Dipteronia sinensis TaxID=43782 RepID=A0AAE0EGU0_9ROSI|nr:hypothetical protein Dsin_007134 [Dipteronia sinensis]